jgi:uncharacterized protein
LTISWHGVEFELLAARAVFLPVERSILVADLHLGKESTFRSRGMPIPNGSSEKTLQSLQTLVIEKDAKAVYILGDLFHGAEAAAAQELFTQFCASLEGIRVVWILGNHDRHTRGWASPCETTRELFACGLRLRHEPQTDGLPTVCGHIHPGFRVTGKAKRAEKLPCFHVTTSNLVIPAFGDFTGLYAIEPDRGDLVYVVAGSEVMEIPSPWKHL